MLSHAARVLVELAVLLHGLAQQRTARLVHGRVHQVALPLAAHVQQRKQPCRGRTSRGEGRGEGREFSKVIING